MASTGVAGARADAEDDLQNSMLSRRIGGADGE
jgi:hypothetical protein